MSLLSSPSSSKKPVAEVLPVAAVSVLASLFAAEAKESQGALELEDCLLENATAFLLN